MARSDAYAELGERALAELARDLGRRAAVARVAHGPLRPVHVVPRPRPPRARPAAQGGALRPRGAPPESAGRAGRDRLRGRDHPRLPPAAAVRRRRAVRLLRADRRAREHEGGEPPLREPLPRAWPRDLRLRRSGPGRDVLRGQARARLRALLVGGAGRAGTAARDRLRADRCARAQPRRPLRAEGGRLRRPLRRLLRLGRLLRPLRPGRDAAPNPGGLPLRDGHRRPRACQGTPARLDRPRAGGGADPLPDAASSTAATT